MSQRTRWNEAAISRFLGLCQQALPRDRIAEKLGLSVRQVASLDRYLRRNGRQPFKLAYHTARTRMRLAQHEDEIRRLVSSGTRPKDIASRYGVSGTTVTSFMHRRGICRQARSRNGEQRLPRTGQLAEKRVSLADVNCSSSEFTHEEICAGAWLAEQMEEA